MAFVRVTSCVGGSRLRDGGPKPRTHTNSHEITRTIPAVSNIQTHEKTLHLDSLYSTDSNRLARLPSDSILSVSTIYTIGHGRHAFVDFLELLLRYDIQFLCDVRSVARS